MFTFFLFSESGLHILNSFDFYFDLIWIAWHWKPPRCQLTQRAKSFVVAPNQLPFSLLHFTVQKTICRLYMKTRVRLIHLLLDYRRWVPFEPFVALLKPNQITLQWSICRLFKLTGRWFELRMVKEILFEIAKQTVSLHTAPVLVWKISPIFIAFNFHH